MPHILCRKSCITGIALANELGWTYGPNCEVGDFAVSYGIKRPYSALNSAYVGDKLAQLIQLGTGGFTAPRVLSINTERITEEDLEAFSYPILARRARHTRGTDILWLPKLSVAKKKIGKIRSRDFIVEYIPIDKEYRVHVLGKRWHSISQKMIPEDVFNTLTTRQKAIRVVRFGWAHIPVPDTDQHRDIVGSIAVNAAKHLGFDFGAVDIAVGENRKIYVLEINSAPALNGRRIEMYAKYMKDTYRKRVLRKQKT